MNNKKIKGFICLEYRGTTRYVNVSHIISFNATNDGVTIKTVDGYVHKTEETIGAIVNQIADSQ